MKNPTYVLLYDGSCGFCNFWVKWILKNDQKRQFQFAPLQGEYGQEFLQRHLLDTQHFDTLYLVQDADTYYKKLGAVMKICQTLGGRYKLALVGHILPRFIQNAIYNLIARNRKKLMGEYCYLPTPEERTLFLQ